MKVADELRAAAAALRERAANATPGPWTLYDRGVCWELNELDEHDGTCFREGDARWIATMNPRNAAPLAAWLDYEAGCLDEWMHVGRPYGSASYRDTDGRAQAITFARDINAITPVSNRKLLRPPDADGVTSPTKKEGGQ